MVPDRPPCLETLRGLVEQATLRAGEGKWLVGAHPAALELLLLRGGLHDVVAAVGVYGHAPFCPMAATAVRGVASPCVR